MTTNEQPPPRLAESAGAAGDLVRRALSEQAPTAGLPRFTQLQERRVARSRRQTVVVLAAASLALVLGLRSWRASEPPLVVQAEPAPFVTTSASAAPVSAPVELEEPVRPPSPSKPPSRRDATSKPRAAVGVPSPRADAGDAEPLKDLAAPSEPAGSAKACAELARGDAEGAIGCYAKLATGSGVTAELAFFEQARLAGKALRQPARALALLDQHRQRFPNGSLRAEAMLARIEWSLAVGDQARARAEVDEALDSGLLNERRAELERVRAALSELP